MLSFTSQRKANVVREHLLAKLDFIYLGLIAGEQVAYPYLRFLPNPTATLPHLILQKYRVSCPL